MATRQYIGARYVPKFYQNSVDGSTQWQANVVYEPLVYVTLTNGNMYISKKEVPATIGTPAENIEYWLDVGNYNGQIENLQNQIDDIETSVTDLQNQTDDIETTVTDLQNDIKNTPVIDVVLNGIDNTGATDVTAAVQTLMNENPQTTLYFRKGTYKFDNDLDVKCSMVGDASGTYLRYNGTGNFLRYVQTYNHRLENFDIYCNTTDANNIGIYCNDSAMLKFKNLHLYKCSIYMTICRVCYLENIFSDAAYKGIYLGSCVRIFTNNFEFDNTVVHGIEIEKSSNDHISDVISFSNGECNGSGEEAIHCHDMTDGFAKFYFVQVSSPTTSGWKFENTTQMSLICCYSESGPKTVPTGITLKNANEMTIYDFHAVGFTENAMKIIASKRVTIDSCHIWACPQGILMVSTATIGCEDCLITNCHIYYGITTGIIAYRTSSQPRSKNCLITNNFIEAASPLNVGDSTNIIHLNNYNAAGEKLNEYTGTTGNYGQITIPLKRLTQIPKITFIGDNIGSSCLINTATEDGYYTSAQYEIFYYTVENGEWVMKPLNNTTIRYIIE